MKTSRIPGFYKKTVDERRTLVAEMHAFTDEAKSSLFAENTLSLDVADNMIENVIGMYPLPLGLGLNFLVNDKEYKVPMALEEPSVIAAASNSAKLIRDAGGFIAEAPERLMIGQIQVVGCDDFAAAKEAVLQAKTALLAEANKAHPSMVARGGGAEDLEVRLLNEASDSPYSQMLIVHLYVGTCDAMGANVVNTMVESLAPAIEQLTGGKVYLRILSNYADRSLARSKCVIPPHLLGTADFSGEEVRDGIIQAYEFAASDPYRAVTHNKGIMNGIDPVVLATGNDWRAVAAGAHAYAARDGHYSSMTSWSVDDAGNLVGELELPMAIGIVGGTIRVHPVAQLSLEILDVASASELAEVIVSVGLAQNFGALRALVTEGIQKGHMALHARSVALAAGAAGDMVNVIAEALIAQNDIRVSTAERLIGAAKQ